MVDAFSDVKKKIHVNLDAWVKVLRGVCFCVCTICCMAVVQEITLNGLSTACFPSSTATDKLATLHAAEREKEVATPFPYIEVADFLPPWAAVARRV